MNFHTVKIIRYIVTVEKNDRGQVIYGTYKERNGNNWEVCEADLNKLVGVIRPRASFSESSLYINFLMTLEEFNRHKMIPLRKHKGKRKYPNIILSYPVTGCITADSNSKYRNTQHSTRKAVEELIINNPNEKPQRILGKFDQQINIIDRDTDSIVSKNTNEKTNIRPVIARKNVTGITNEITSVLAYLLGQPEGKTIKDPSIEEQPFLQKILFRNAKEPSYVLYLNQSLTDSVQTILLLQAIGQF